MEIVKFIFACFGSFITTVSFLGGLWVKHQKLPEDQISTAESGARERIKTIESKAREEIKEVRKGAIIKTEKQRAA